MKKYQLHTKPDDILNRFPALRKHLEAAARTPEGPGAPRVLCLGADLEKAGVCVAVQCGLGTPVHLGTLTRESLLALVGVLLGRGWRSVVGLEACGFGWRFQRQLRAAGAEVLTFATEALTGRRKTNPRDAAALAQLVAGRTVHGNTRASRVVREPSPEEQQRRYLSRHRGQLVALRGKIEAHGRGLLYDHGPLAFPECWWGKKKWPQLRAQLRAAGEAWLGEALTPQRTMAQAVHAQILVLDIQLAAQAAVTLTIPLPHGLGQLTALTACLEVMDWQRFSNRKKVGRLPAPSGAALRAKAPLFGYLAPLDSSAARPARAAPAPAASSSAASTGRATAACAACSPKPSGGCSAGNPAGTVLPNGGPCCAPPTAAPCAKRKPSSPACACSSSTSGGSSPAGPPWPTSASAARPPQGKAPRTLSRPNPSQHFPTH